MLAPIDPDREWARARQTQRFVEVNLADPTKPKEEGTTRFVCLSDTHASHASIPFVPEGDVLVHAGDFSNVGLEKDVISFNRWLGELPHAHKVVIAGNHDIPFDAENYLPVRDHSGVILQTIC